jgi:hypothetical protein
MIQSALRIKQFSKGLKMRIKILVLISILLIFTQVLSGCAVINIAVEGAAAGLLEEPSMELVLDRVNTAASAADIAGVAFNNVPVSDDSTWPQDLNYISGKDIVPVLRALAFDGAYAAHGGIISNVKAHVVLSQHILYSVPPDMYSSEGACYKKGEATIINGYYYKINSYNDIIKKANPSKVEIKQAVNTIVANIFKTGNCKEKQTLLKRKGKLKPQAGSNVYNNIYAAMFKILPNGNDLKDAHKEYNRTRMKLLSISDSIAALEKDKKRLKDKKQALGKYKNIAAVNEQININRSRKKEVEAKLQEANNIFLKILNEISEHKGEVTDKKALKTLENIKDASKAVENLLDESIGMTTIALAKLPNSLRKLPQEFNQLKDSVNKARQKIKISSVYIPVRMARLRFNAGNIKDNIMAIITIMKNESKLAAKIHDELDELLAIQK